MIDLNIDEAIIIEKKETDIDIYEVDVRSEATGRHKTYMTTDATIKKGDMVVCESDYGGDFGFCVSDLRDVTSEDLKMIERKATKEDLEAYQINEEEAKKALEFCKAEAKKLELDMHLVMAQYTIDRSKLTFIYTADERVDFRELLKVLAFNFHCRIELRQIGARDKAKIVKGVGPCGRELCCGKFINDFDMVSINMAKNQLLALNIQKLSGHCGKLMCCLKFEDEAYKELREGLPKINASIEYEGENYRVTSMNVIARTAKLENRENAIYITLDDLLSKGHLIQKKPKKEVKSETPEELSE